MKSLVNRRAKSLWLSFVLFSVFYLVFTPFQSSAAEPGGEKPPFTIELPQGWSPAPSRYQGVSAAYALQNSGARLDISVQEAQKGEDVGSLKWEDLFYPQFDAIDIRMDARTSIDSVPAKYCLYKVKKTPFKKQLEGSRDLMYLNYVLVKGGRLYSLTFSDDEGSFAANQPAFMKMVRTLRFDPA